MGIVVGGNIPEKGQKGKEEEKDKHITIGTMDHIEGEFFLEEIARVIRGELRMDRNRY